jgi:hypothetical protein
MEIADRTPVLVIDVGERMIFADGPTRAKVKARDIIGGWPHSRSHLPDYLDCRPVRIGSLLVLPLDGSETLDEWILGYPSLADAERALTRRYHSWQAEMEAAYLRAHEWNRALIDAAPIQSSLVPYRRC